MNEGLGSRVEGLGFRVWGLGFRVQGRGLQGVIYGDLSAGWTLEVTLGFGSGFIGFRGCFNPKPHNQKPKSQILKQQLRASSRPKGYCL